MSQATTMEPMDDSSMSLMEHLKELRTRLIWIVGGLLIGTLASMAFVEQILQFVIEPLTSEGVIPQALGPTDTIGIFFKISFTVGASIAMPVIIYQIIAF